MSRVPSWFGRLGAVVGRWGKGLEKRRAEADAERRLPLATPPPPGDVPSPPSHGPRTARPDSVSAVPWGIRVAAEASWRFLVLAAAVWVLTRIVSAIHIVVLAFVAALLISALLQPAVARLKRHGVPRGLATALTTLGGFVFLGLIGWFVVWQVSSSLTDLGDQLTGAVNGIKHWLLKSPFHVTSKQINDIAGNLTGAIGKHTKEISSAGLQGVTLVVELLTGAFLAFFSTIFLLYDGPRIWRWTLKLVPAQARPALAGAGPRAWRTLTAYVRGTIVVALIDAVFIGIGIYVLGVPLAVPLAVIIFLGAFVPLVGAVVSSILAVIVALVTQGLLTAVLVVVVVLFVQQIEGHVLQPFILGRAVSVHPLAVVLSVATGSVIAGIGGAVVAVPLVAVVNTLVGYLRVYAQRTALMTPYPHGASALSIAPIAPPPPQAAHLPKLTEVDEGEEPPGGRRDWPG